MLIPIGRPLIDARNIRAAAAQTITGNDAIAHNNRAVVFLTINNTGDNTCTLGNGAVVGQKLMLIVDTKTAGEIIIADSGNASLNGQWYRPYVGMSLELVWDGSAWVEQRRHLSYEVTASHGATGILATCFGYDGQVSGDYSAHFGFNGEVTGSYSACFGANGIAAGTASTHFGSGGYASGGYSTHFGANGQTAGNYSTHYGVGGSAPLYGQFVQSGGKFGTAGDAQYSRVVLRGSTTDATLTQIYLDGVDDELTILDEHSYACTVTVIGRQDTGADSVMARRMVLIERTGGTVALVGAVQTIGTDINPGGLGAGGGNVLELTADDTAKALAIKVEGLVAHNVRWVVLVEMVQAGYAD